MSTFVLRREYALQMPTNFVDVDMDEMEYVDGGIALKTTWVAAGLNAAIGIAIGGGVGIAGIKAYINRVGKEEAKRIFTRSLKSKIIAIGAGSFAFMVEWVIVTVMNVLDPGGYLANLMDANDTYGTNGWIG